MEEDRKKHSIIWGKTPIKQIDRGEVNTENKCVYSILIIMYI